MTLRPAKTQISLGIRPVWSESSLCAQWIAKDQSFLHADSEDSDQTGRMPRLIWVFAGRTVILLVLSWGGSNWFPGCFPRQNIFKKPILRTCLFLSSLQRINLDITGFYVSFILGKTLRTVWRRYCFFTLVSKTHIASTGLCVTFSQLDTNCKRDP